MVYIGDQIIQYVPPPPPPPPEVVHAKAVARGAQCQKCPLYGCNRGPVMGTIRPGAKLIAIGEAPGNHEVEQKEGFVGPSGRILDVAVAEGGLSRKEISYTNTILCQPEDGNFSEYIESLRAQHRKAEKKWERSWLGSPGDAAFSPTKRTSTAHKRYEQARVDALKDGTAEPEGPPAPPILPQHACRPRLERDIAESGATVLLAVGRQALEQTRDILGLLSAHDKKESDKPKVAGIKKQHGAPVLLPDGRVLMATYHPAFAMRDKREYMPVIQENIARAARIALRGGKIHWSEPEYQLSPSVEAIERTLHMFLESRAEVTIDIETDSGDAHATRIRCVGLGANVYGHETIIVVPFRHMDGTPWWEEEIKVRLGMLVRRVMDECPLVFQNGQFDTTVMLRCGVMTRRDKTWTDTLILHHDTKDNDLPHDLGFITRRYFEVPLWKENVDHKSISNTSDYYLHLYNARDVLATMRVVTPLRYEIIEANTAMQVETDTKILPDIRDMSELGLPVNEWKRGEFSLHFNQQCNQLKREFQKIVGKKINPRSAPQLRELLYSDWGYKPVLATDGFNWDEEEDDEEDGSTSNAALTRLMKERQMEHESHWYAIDTLFKFRANDKLRGVNTDNLKTYPIDCDAHFSGLHYVGTAPEVRGIRYDKKTDEEIECIVLPERRGLSLARSTFKNHVVPTGRLASGDPINFQNITKRARGNLNMRSMYCAPPGHVIVGADYEQIEARLYARIAGDAMLLDAIDKKLDLHSLNCASLLAKPGQDVREVYKWLKAKPKDELTYWRTVAKRFCIAEGELVLTDRGEVPIEDVQRTDKVWDGVEWVAHDGVVFQGYKEVMEYDGLRATADHKVWLEDGRKVRFDEAAAERSPLAWTGEGRHEIRFVADRKRSLARTWLPESDRALHALRDSAARFPGQSPIREIESLSLLRYDQTHDAALAARSIVAGEGPLYQSEQSAVEGLRRARGAVSLSVSGSRSSLGTNESRFASRPSNRPNEQRGALRAQQPALGYGQGKRAQSPYAKGEAEVTRVRVYDILNAGPRRRFTVSRHLVSNCFL